jgi:MFS-type transporter involved in bile tolerance (Atg22 family)
MFGLAVYFGAVYGAFQGYARALYAEMIPPGEEARWCVPCFFRLLFVFELTTGSAGMACSRLRIK